MLKEISPEFSLEGLMLKLRLQYFGHLMRRADSLEKTLMLGKIEGGRRKGRTENVMVGWHRWLNGHGFGWTPRVGDGQGGLACCSSWGCKELDMTEWLHFHFSLSLSCIGEGNSNPLQCSCLENPKDGGAWWAAVYGVSQSWTWAAGAYIWIWL